MRVCYQTAGGRIYASEEFELRDGCKEELVESLFGEVRGVLTFLEGLSALYQHENVLFSGRLTGPKLCIFHSREELPIAEETYWVNSFGNEIEQNEDS